MGTTYIYALKDPRDDSVRYVGRTAHPDWRVAQHCYTRFEKNAQKREWIESLLALELKPVLEVLEVYERFDGRARCEVEKKWILHFMEQGAPLVNIKGVLEP